MGRLREITHRVNDKLLKIFNLPISLSYHFIGADFNKIKRGTTKAKDGKIHSPKIILSAQLNHKVVKDTRAIYHPRSFFNEAKLTVVALAMRLSIYEMMISNMPDCAEMLIIDDLLVSLDMCNRIKVIDVILDYEKRNKQLIIMTHDRGLYNLIRNKVEENEIWKCYELYSKYEGYDNEKIPVPVIIEHSNYLEQAHKHIKSFDFPAAANSLRKECESMMKRLLPENWQYSVSDDGTHQYLTLHGMISQGTKFNEYFQIALPFNNLDTYRERILNPFSHDDLKTPLYRGELISLLKDIEELKQVKIKDVISTNAIGKDSYHFEITSEKGIISADFTFLERFSVVVYHNTIYYANPEIKVTYCNLPSWNNRIGRLRRFLKDLSARAKTDYMTSYDNILDLRSGISLVELVKNVVKDI